MGKKDQEKNACIYHRLSKLIYVPFTWTQDDQHIWRQMAHLGMSSSSSAFDSASACSDCRVLPISTGLSDDIDPH